MQYKTHIIRILFCLIPCFVQGIVMIEQVPIKNLNKGSIFAEVVGVNKTDESGYNSIKVIYNGCILTLGSKWPYYMKGSFNFADTVAVGRTYLFNIERTTDSLESTELRSDNFFIANNLLDNKIIQETDYLTQRRRGPAEDFKTGEQP